MSEPLSPEQEPQAQELATRIQARSADAILEMARRLYRRDTLRRHGVRTSRSSLGHRRRSLQRTPPPKTGYTTSAIDCPNCQRTANFHSYRQKRVETLGGSVTCNRAYYYCPLCQKGSCPWDQRVSPAVERLTTLCGAVADSFEKGAELLHETAAIWLSESTVERTTETVG